MSKHRLREKIEKDTNERLGNAIIWIIGLIILSALFKNQFDNDVIIYICISLILFVKMLKVTLLDVIRTYIYPYIDSQEASKVVDAKFTDVKGDYEK